MTEDRDLAALLHEAMTAEARTVTAGSRFSEQVIGAATAAGLSQDRQPAPRAWRGWLLPAVAAVVVAVLLGAVLFGGSLLRSNRQQPSSRVTPLPQPSTSAPGVSQSASSPVPSPVTSGSAIPSTAATTEPTATGTSGSTAAPTATTAPTASTTQGPGGATGVPVGGPVPAGFRAVDLSWISNQDGWALGTAPCAVAPCTSIVRTSDGGRSWVGIPAPKARLSQTDSCPSGCDLVTRLRFANARVGYAFSSDALFLTTDGGSHWLRQVGGYAYSLEIVDGMALRVIGQGPSCAPGCSFKVQRAAIGGTDWRDIALPSGGQNAGAQLGASGDTVVLATFGHTAGGAENATSALFTSTNGGRGWRKVGEPCPRATGAGSGEVDTVAVTVAPDSSISGLCTPRDGNGAQFTVTSTDGGAHFAAAPASLGAAGGTAFGAASATTLLASLDQLYRSTDGGKRWQPTRNGGQAPVSASYIGFESSSVGRVLGVDGSGSSAAATVWTTTDAGASWSAHTFR